MSLIKIGLSYIILAAVQYLPRKDIAGLKISNGCGLFSKLPDIVSAAL
jgi:hypothetical protein